MMTGTGGAVCKGATLVYRTHGATICISEVGISNTVSRGARVLKNFGAPLATKFTYKMRSGGKGMWGRGPALYKHNYL
jgi:hypothetical protein